MANLKHTALRFTTHDSEIPADSKIQKRIHFIRHAQSTFNKAYAEAGYKGDPMKFDARLTGNGFIFIPLIAVFERYIINWI
jgi:hypothetical protein